MILIINKSEANSRAFYAKHKNEFTEILDYPNCLKRFPELSRFPAVAIDVPEYFKDNSLWYAVKKLPDYKRLGMVTQDCVDIVHRLSAGCADNGIALLDKYIKDREIGDTDKRFLVELCNDFALPARFTWWASQYTYDLGEEYKGELDEKNMDRSISYDLTLPAIESIPAHFEIMYPETIDDAIQVKQKWIDKIERRDAVYKGK